MSESDHYINSQLEILRQKGFEVNPEVKQIKRWGELSTARIQHNIALAALVWLKQPANQSENDTHKILMAFAVFQAFIVNYRKCFAPEIKGINPNMVFRNRPILLETHEKLIRWRNNYAAHSDTSDLVFVDMAIKNLDNKILILNHITYAIPDGHFEAYMNNLQALDQFITSAFAELKINLEKLYGKPFQETSYSEIKNI